MQGIVIWTIMMWKAGSFGINLFIDDFVYLYHHKIQFYDNILKLGL